MESFNQSIIKHKTGLLNLAVELGNISKACRIMGFSRDKFYRYQAARNAGGVEALFEVSRRKPNLKNRVEEATEQATVGIPRSSERQTIGRVKRLGKDWLLLESESRDYALVPGKDAAKWRLEWC